MSGRVSLIAHRGQPESFPENSLQGFRHCLQSGAHYLETDIHITADGIPVLSHDANLLKLTGKQIIIADHAYDKLREIPAGFAERFADTFNDHRLATLRQFSALLKDWDDVTCFIELKGSSLNYFGNRAVDLTMDAIAPISSQCIFISFEYDALVYARQQYDLPIGWVLSEWSEESREQAAELSPEYLLVDVDICPLDQAEIWHGSWTWVAYTINNAEQVALYAGIGIELLETNRYSKLVEESDIIEVSHDF